ncbi:putrescine-binding periplasmic protein [Spirochaetia bacterium]|nr:putrescine-binding periplasmic protein [Spirochaetia bacterium]
MKKFRFPVILALLGLPLVLGPHVSPVSAQNRSRQLVLYTWEEMFPQTILDGFKAATGIEVVYDKTFVLNEEMLSELEAVNGGSYDLVIADDYIIEFAIDEGLAQKLNKTKLGNYANINPFYQHQFYDPNDDYTIPYGAGVQTIVYDPAKVRLNITGYTDLWNSQLKSRVGIIGNYRVINGMALQVLGKSYNTENLADIKAAGQRLLALAPNIRIIDDTALDQELLSGNISAAVMYTSGATNALKTNPALKAVYPKEGIGFGVMGAFIPSRAPNADAAHAFLNYILDAKRGAECFEFLGYYCTFSASEQFISPENRKYVLMPKDPKDTNRFLFGNFEMVQNLSAEAEEVHGQIWTAFNLAIK